MPFHAAPACHLADVAFRALRKADEVVALECGNRGALRHAEGGRRFGLPVGRARSEGQHIVDGARSVGERRRDGREIDQLLDVARLIVGGHPLFDPGDHRRGLLCSVDAFADILDEERQIVHPFP
jgi:hypothetical protein